jgi:hypothetical protein
MDADAGTPGKALDWSLKFKFFDLKKISVFVLDEADVMIATQGHQDQSIRSMIAAVAQDPIRIFVFVSLAVLQSFRICYTGLRIRIRIIFGSWIRIRNRVTSWISVLGIRIRSPHVFGPPGSVSGSISQRSGSDSCSFPFLINVSSGLK